MANTNVHQTLYCSGGFCCCNTYELPEEVLGAIDQLRNVTVSSYLLCVTNHPKLSRLKEVIRFAANLRGVQSILTPRAAPWGSRTDVPDGAPEAGTRVWASTRGYPRELLGIPHSTVAGIQEDTIWEATV